MKNEASTNFHVGQAQAQAQAISPIETHKSEHISNSLVPFLDMFNHKTGVKNKIQVWTDEIELRINEEINSEEEIFIDYGPWVKL